MIIPNSSTYWALKDQMSKENDDKYSYAKKKNSKDGRLYRTGKNSDELFLNGSQAYEDSYIEIDVDYVYRAVSPEEMDYINKTGFIKSNQSKNIGYEVDRGITCYKDSFPGAYLPETGGYILKIKVLPENEFFYDENDDYVKTEKAVPKSQIVQIYGEKDKNLSLTEIYNHIFNLEDFK